MKMKTFSSTVILEGATLSRTTTWSAMLTKNTTFKTFSSLKLVGQLSDVMIRFNVLNLREPGSVLRTQGFI